MVDTFEDKIEDTESLEAEKNVKVYYHKRKIYYKLIFLILKLHI